MSLKDNFIKEIKSLGAAMLFFACWIAVLVAGKMLILAEYKISFTDWSVILIGALILSKVVLLLEHVSLGNWVARQPAWVDLSLRTALYGLGVLVVLVLEGAFEARHEQGGFIAALANLPEQTNFNHVLANTIGLTGALLTFNFINLLRRYLQDNNIGHILRQPPPANEQAE